MPIDPLSALGLAMDAIGLVRRAIQGKLLVTPNALSFGGSEWQHTQALTVINETDRPLFDVVVGIWSDDRPVMSDLPLDLTSVDGSAVGPVVRLTPQIAMDAGCLGLRGHCGAHGVVLIFLRQMNPHQAVRLGVTGHVRSRFHVFTEALEFSKKQTRPLYTTGPDGQVLVPIHLPIEMTVSGMMAYIKTT